MAQDSATVLWNDIRTGKIAQVYLFSGSEELLIERAVNSLLQALLGDEGRDFNLNVLHGASLDAGSFLNTAFIPPMFSDRRVVLLQEARAVNWTEELSKAVVDLPESTYLIMVADEDSAGTEGARETAAPKSRKKAGSGAGWKNVVSAAASKGRVVEFRQIPKWEMESWIVGEAKRAGLDMSREAALELFSRTGSDLRLIATELEKLVVYVGAQGGPVSQGDVATVVGRSSLDSIFDLVDAIAARRSGQALRSLQQLLDGGEAPQYLLFMIARQFRLLLTVKALKAEHAPPQTLFRPLGTGSEYMVKKCAEQSRHFTLEALENGLAAALRTDLRLKSTRGSTPEIELQSLVATLCQ